MGAPITFSDRAEDMDAAFIHAFLAGSYWAQDRTLDEVRRCIAHSLNIGLFLEGRQIGYARLVTDRTVLGYLMDVSVDDAYRGRGLGRRLMEHVLAHPDVARLRTIRLATADAHGLYARLGFRPSANDGKLMERVRP